MDEWYYSQNDMRLQTMGFLWYLLSERVIKPSNKEEVINSNFMLTNGRSKHCH